MTSSPGGTVVEPLARRVAIAGAVLFGATYLASVFCAGVGLVADSRGNSADRALFIPVGGPFATISGSTQSGTAVVLAAAGVAQSAGVVMTVVGLLADTGPGPSGPTSRVPTVVALPRAISLAWRF